MKQILYLALAASALAQTTTSRPVSTGGLQARQMTVAALSSCTITAPCKPMVIPSSTVVDTGDVYLGQSLNGVPNAGQVGVGAVGAITLVIKDGNGVTWVNAAFSAATSGVQNNPLAAINGLYLANGFSLYCTDSSSGTSCAASNIQLYWQR